MKGRKRQLLGADYVGPRRVWSRSEVVAWGYRKGDIQLCSDEDWERQAIFADEWRKAMAAAQVAQAIANAYRQMLPAINEMALALRRIGRAGISLNEQMARMAHQLGKSLSR